MRACFKGEHGLDDSYFFVSKWTWPRATCMMMTHLISLFTDPISLSNCMHVSNFFVSMRACFKVGVPSSYMYDDDSSNFFVY